MFIVRQKQEQFNNWFVLTDILIANGDEPNLIVPKVCTSSSLFFLNSFLALAEINIVRMKIVNDFVF